MKPISYVFFLMLIFIPLSMRSDQMDHLEKLLQYGRHLQVATPSLTAYLESDDETLLEDEHFVQEIVAVLQACSTQLAPEEFNALVRENDAFLDALMQEEDEYPTKKRLKSKKFCNLLVTNCLKGCGDTVLNNLTVTGNLIACGGKNLCAGSSSIGTGTSCDIPLTLVLRDTTGSFVATTITLTGNSLINYSTDICDPSEGYIWAPTYYNTLIGLGAGASNTITGSNNVALGFEALMSSELGERNIAIGSGALQYAYDSRHVGPLRDHIAIGYQALQNVNTGFSGSQLPINLALGNFALTNNSDGSYNIAVGHESLYSNYNGTQNIGIGYQALYNNDSDELGDATDNIGIGMQALYYNVDGNANIAIGTSALFTNSVAYNNIGIGYQALYYNDSDGYGNATDNIAIGSQALYSNIDSYENIAIGSNALASLVEGVSGHVALGYYALNAYAPSAFVPEKSLSNTALGLGSLENLTLGYTNIAIGALSADNYVSDESGNIVIGTQAIAGDKGVTRIGYFNDTNLSDYIQTASCFIAGIRGVTTDMGDAIPVLIDSNGQLGTVSSSARFKTAIQDMGESTDDLINLRPVTFKYNAHEGTKREYGLIAEEVDRYFPDIVVRNKDGEIETIQYHYLPTMLLNEWQKDHNLLVKALLELEKQNKRIEELEKHLLA